MSTLDEIVLIGMASYSSQIHVSYKIVSRFYEKNGKDISNFKYSYHR
jgi:hypothetical protein